MKRDKRYNGTLLAILILAMGAGIVLSIPFFKSLSQARQELKKQKALSRQQDAVVLRELSFTTAPNPKVRLWLGPAEVRDAVEFQGNVFTATSGGLVEFGPDGRRLQHWTSAEGFPSLDITALTVSNDSLWAGTADSGWLRYHDSNWKQYLPADPALRSVRALLATRQGPVFIGTTSGVLQFDGREYRAFYPEQLGNASITRLAGDALTLWIGTFNSGLFVFKRGELKQYRTDHGMPDSLVTDIAQEGNTAYISTPAGIVRAENDQFQPLLKSVFVHSLQKRGADLWAATRDRGLMRISTESSVRRPASNAASFPKAERTVLRRVGNSLLAFASGKAWRLGPNDRWQIWSESESDLSDSNISSLFRASDGRLWIGYFDRGLDVLNQDLEKVSHHQDDLLFCVNYLSGDATGRIYVSTANGLAVIHPDGSRRIYRQQEGLLSDRVMQAVPLDSDGNRVAIATAQGFTLMENGSLKSIYAFHGLVNNHVYSIAARGDQIYVGTLGGISRINDMQVVSSWTQMDSGLKRNWVNALLTLDNQLLVGTYGSGIQARTETGDWTAFDSLPEDFEVNPNAFFYDGRYVFCGTLDRGAFVYDTRSRRWKHILRELPGSNATAFARDGSFLYIATDRGLLRISYDDISTLPDLP